MKKIGFFDTKPYDKEYFDKHNPKYGFDIAYYDTKLNSSTAVMSDGCDAIVAFVNDELDEATLDILYEKGVRVIAMRCAGYNNIDFRAAYKRIHVLRVPAYSPYAVAEHTMAMLLSLNRHLPKAYIRTRDFNFSLSGLTGFDLHDKTIGIIGTGKIGRIFVDICNGFGMKIIAYDPFPVKESSIDYVELDELFSRADIISLHCPLTKESKHIIDAVALNKMKKGVYIINTSRGALIDSEALLEAIISEKVGGAGLDVYEEETELFYEDFSNTIIKDNVLIRLIAMPNVLVTSHQAFLTREALDNIAETTLMNLQAYFKGAPLENEICYQCIKNDSCRKNHLERCF